MADEKNRAPIMAPGVAMPPRTAAWRYKGGAWTLLRRLKGYPSWREEGFAFAGYASLAEDLGVSVDTIARRFVWLVQQGELTRKWTMQGE